MKRLVITGILILFALTATTSISDAWRSRRWHDKHWWRKRSWHYRDTRSWRGWRGSGGWGHHSDYQRKYDPKTISTVKGKVKAVKLITPMSGMSNGIHLKLKTDSEVKSVHLGPSWYIRRQDIQIKKGDTIEARGSKIVYKDKPVIIAAEVKKGDYTLVLRGDDGYPRWSGTRRGRW
jgi:hypothetical protein